MLVVDVSYHNGSIDWAKAYQAGVRGAIIRCGYGSDKQRYDDPKFRENITGALAAGIKVGVYIYSYAKTIESAKSEAAHVLRLVNPYKSRISLPIYYDLEEPGTESGAKERAIAFGDIIEANGYTCGVYASAYWWDTYLKGLERFTKWVAKWGGDKPTKYSNMDLWQYDAYGKVAGIGSGVDLDHAYGELLEIINGKEPTPTPTPQPGGKIMIGVDVLKKGSKGSEVFIVQSFLKCKGYKGENGKVLTLDQSWGRNVDYAFGNWQRDAGLVVDKICGEKSWNKMING